LFIAGNAFPRSCAVTLAGSDSNAEFGAWNQNRQLGSSDALKWRISEMGELARKESGDNDEAKTPSERMEMLDWGYPSDFWKEKRPGVCDSSLRVDFRVNMSRNGTRRPTI
jgi:hypothetical protein